MPFTDPMADGPAIQAAGLRALAAGANMKKTLAAVREFRAGDDATPIVLMGYYNPIYVYGVDKFLADAKAAGVDGLIVVDLPPEEDAELCLPALKAGFNFIRLATPTTDDKRLPAVLTNTSGFVYYVSITGITGSAAPDAGKVAAAVARIKRHTKLPVCVGFGVRTAEQARAIAEGADGVVVGSALVEAVREQSRAPAASRRRRRSPAVGDLVRTLAEGVRARGALRRRAIAAVRHLIPLPLNFGRRPPHISPSKLEGYVHGPRCGPRLDVVRGVRDARAGRTHAPRAVPARGHARRGQPAWEPPVDILETEFEVLVLVALPGVDTDDAQAVIEDGDLVIAGTRDLPAELRTRHHPSARTAARAVLPAAAAAGRPLWRRAPRRRWRAVW